jgi:ComF family protein
MKKLRATSWWTQLTRLLTQPVCLGCDAELGLEIEALCEKCRACLHLPEGLLCQTCGVPINPVQAAQNDLTCRKCEKRSPHFERLRGATGYGRVAKLTVHALKYSKRLDVAPLMIGQMANAYNRFFYNEPPDLLLPIPLHPRREFKRGFNQADVLAKGLTSLIDVEIAPPCIRRVRNTTQQVALSLEDRHQNLQAAFAVTDQSIINDSHLMLIDDVATTCSTLNETAKALLAAGARRVDALVFARTLE